MLVLKTKRMELHALTRDQLNLALENVDSLSKALKAVIPADVFSNESRQAMLIKLTRMDFVDPVMHPWYTYFLLLDAAERRGMGVCGFKGAPTQFGSVELGYAIHEDFRNRGLMTEAVSALVDWAFRQDGCDRVTAETLRENIASQRVLQKAGLVYDRGHEHMIYWKIDRADWAARANGQGQRVSA